MRAEVAMAVGDDVFVRFADSASTTDFTAIGRVRNDDDAGTAEALPAGTFRVTEDVAAGEIFALHLDLSPVA